MLRTLLYGFLMILSVFACSVKAAESGQKPTLRWLGHWKDEGLREKLVLEALEDFRFLNQDIDVRFEFASDVLTQKTTKTEAQLIAEMVRSGTVTWDVVWMDSIIYQQVAVLLHDPFWGRKHLVDFSNIPDVKNAHRPELIHSPDFLKQTGGIFTGPYTEGFLYCVWYNTEVAKKLGLTIREEEMTLNDLLGYLERVHEYNQTADSPISAVVDFFESGCQSRLAHNLYLSVARENKSDEMIATAQKAVLQALEKIGSVYPFTNRKEASWQDMAELLLENKALFTFDATWRYNCFQDYSPALIQKLHLAQMPGLQKQTFYCGGFLPVWAVMKASPVRESAIRLMQFWCTPDMADKWIRYTKNPTGISGSLYDPEYGEDPFAVYQRRLTGGRKMHPDLFAELGTHKPVESLLPLISPLLEGTMTAEEAWQKLENTTP